MLEIGSLRSLRWKVCLLEAEGWRECRWKPGWIWLIGNPMEKGFGSYSHKPVESVDSVDQFCQPTPLYLLLFFPWK